jgi:hypothetical protein
MAASKERYEGAFKSDTATDASNKQASVNWAGVNENNAEDLLSMRDLLLKSKERQADDMAARLANLVSASSEPHIWTEALGMAWNANNRAVTGNRVTDVDVTKQKKRPQQEMTEQQEQQKAERGRQLAVYQKEFHALRCTKGTAAQREVAGKRRGELLRLMKPLR